MNIEKKSVSNEKHTEKEKGIPPFRKKLLALKEYLRKKYDLRYDRIADDIDCRKKNFENNFSGVKIETLLDDIRENVSYKTKDGWGCSFSKSLLEEVLGSRDFVKEYDPLQNFLEQCLEKQLQEKGDPFDDFVSLFDFESDSKEEKAFAKKAFQKWFVGAVKSVFEEDYVPKQVLVLHSTKENIGKTSLLNALLPRELKRYGAYNPNLRFRDKDAMLLLAQCWIVFFDEIDLFLNESSGNRDAFKAYVCTEGVNVRPAYGTKKMYRPRIASFLGTCNGVEFTDRKCGKSRFVVISLKNIWNKKSCKKSIYMPDCGVFAENFKYRRLWGEAFRLYLKGFNPMYSDDEMEDLLKRNERHKYVCEVEESIKGCFLPSDKNEGEFLSPVELRNRVFGEDSLVSLKKLGSCLNELGFLKTKKRVNGKLSWGYWVKKVTPDTLLADTNMSSLPTGRKKKNPDPNIGAFFL